MNGHDKENHSLLNIGRPVDHDGRRIGAGKGGDPQDDSLPVQATSRANQSSGRLKWWEKQWRSKIIPEINVMLEEKSVGTMQNKAGIGVSRSTITPAVIC